MSTGIEISSIGELLVEIMRPQVGLPLSAPAQFLGPYPSGAPAIFVDAAARLGHCCAMAGTVGNDDFGTCVLDRLVADGVDTSDVLRLDNCTTGIAFVTYFSDGSRRFLYHLSHSAAGRAAHLNASSVARSKFLHICGSSLAVNKTLRDACYRAVQTASSSGSRISFDPNLRPELIGERRFQEICRPVLERSNVVLPGEHEAEVLAGVKGPERAAEALLERGPAIVVIKRGARGCTVFCPEDSFDVPPFAVEVVDPTGAGDCFDAGFVVGLLEQLPLKRAALLASAAGAMATTRMGPMEGAFFRTDVDKFMELHHVQAQSGSGVES